ncbi:hypothetical protein [Salipiger sp.]|uniref:hypothetical protein n=1 Tax=Salipiger sp. TaxID=2078585 RepID=UPI003A97FCC2
MKRADSRNRVRKKLRAKNLPDIRMIKAGKVHSRRPPQRRGNFRQDARKGAQQWRCDFGSPSGPSNRYAQATGFPD